MTRRKTTETAAWNAARDLVDLPDDLIALYDRVDRITAMGSQPIPTVRPLADYILRGVDDPEAQHTADEARARSIAENNRATSHALRAATSMLKRWFTIERRDELIGDLLRPVVTRLLDEAAPYAEQLSGWTPELDEVAILRRGTDDEIAAWRTSRELDDRYSRLLDCWAATWKAATSTIGGKSVPGHLRPGRPGGVHAWQDPRAVDDPDVRDGRNGDVVAVVTFREAGGFRLATTAEVIELDRRTRLEHPWVAGERMPRRVLLPALPKKLKIPPWAYAGTGGDERDVY